MVFTRAQAHAAGLSDRVLQGPRVQRIFRGVYAEADLASTSASAPGAC